MLQDRPVLGWGWGGFRYNFPKYQAQQPELLGDSRSGALPFWRDVHSDLLQWFIELGIIGMLFPVAALGWWCWTALRLRAWRSPLAFACLAGGAVLFAHAGADFLWQGGAVLALWVLVPAVALLHTRHEREAEEAARAALNAGNAGGR
jgi:O-antigen ligase